MSGHKLFESSSHHIQSLTFNRSIVNDTNNVLKLHLLCKTVIVKLSLGFTVSGHKQANQAMHVCNAVLLVWGLLALCLPTMHILKNV